MPLGSDSEAAGVGGGAGGGVGGGAGGGAAAAGREARLGGFVGLSQTGVLTLFFLSQT